LEEEYQTADGGKRVTMKKFCYVAALGGQGKPSDAVLHKEALVFDNVKLVTQL
jgi:succinate dehydrogenase / fumarate reductase flavoprotein subunit